MENIENEIDDEIDEDEDNFDSYDLILGEEDQWEDSVAYKELKDNMKDGWYMFKVTNYDRKKLENIEQWCRDNCNHEFRKVGWRSGCAYMVAMQFSDSHDAVLYRLMWSS